MGGLDWLLHFFAKTVLCSVQVGPNCRFWVAISKNIACLLLRMSWTFSQHFEEVNSMQCFLFMSCFGVIANDVVPLTSARVETRPVVIAPRDFRYLLDPIGSFASNSAGRGYRQCQQYQYGRMARAGNGRTGRTSISSVVRRRLPPLPTPTQGPRESGGAS